MTAAPARSDSRPAAGNAPPPSWELGEILGEGSWAEIFAARQPGATAFDYALKVPKKLLPGLAMLQREVLIGRAVSHPHLVPILSWQWRGEPFLVMPRLEGCTLRNLLAWRRSEFGCLLGAARFLPQSVWVARQAASALSALHAAGWLHGDVKPENLLVGPSGHVTLIDLGLARKLETRECRGGEVLAGSLAYLSPESFLPAATLTAQSDVYSLGAVLYELLSGEPMFAETDPTNLALLHLRQNPADVREASLDVPPELSQLVMRMISKEQLRRPTAAEVVRQLTRIEIELMGST